MTRLYVCYLLEIKISVINNAFQVESQKDEDNAQNPKTYIPKNGSSRLSFTWSNEQ